MFQCTIELLEPLKQPDDETRFWTVGKYNFDPGVHEKDVIWVYWEVWGEVYELKVKVVGRKREVHPAGNRLKSIGEEAVKEGVFKLRIFVEAEDRDRVIKLSEVIRRNNP